MKRLCHDFNFLIFWLHHYYWPWNCKIWTNQRALGALLMCPLLVGDNNNCQLDSRTGRSGWKWCLIPTKSLPKDVLSVLPNNKLLWGGWFSVLPDQLSSRDTALESQVPEFQQLFAWFVMICIFRPVVWTGAWTCHLTISQILNKSTKSSKNQNKPTQLPVTTTCRKMQYCWKVNRCGPRFLRAFFQVLIVIVFSMNYVHNLE